MKNMSPARRSLLWQRGWFITREKFREYVFTASGWIIILMYLFIMFLVFCIS